MVHDFNAHIGTDPAFPTNVELSDLLTAMKEAGIDKAVVSDIDTAFDYRDDSLSECDFDAVVHFLSIRPDSDPDSIPDDEIRGIRVYPTYHDWDFETYAWEEVLARAEDEGWIIQIIARLLDPRVMPQSAPFPQAFGALGDNIRDYRRIRFVIGGVTLAEVDACFDLFQQKNVWTEISHIQHPINSLPKLIDLLGSDRILFGTNYPFFYPYANLFRVINSPISDEDKSRILEQNAARLLSRRE